MGIKSLLELRPLVTTCWRFAPYRILATFVLMLLSSFASGAGILMIVPLISSVGIDVGATSLSSGLANTINVWANYLGVQLSLGMVLLVYLLLIIFMASTGFLSTTISASLRHSFVVHLRSEIARSLFYAQWRYLNQNHMSDFMRLLTSQVQSSSVSVHSLLALLSSVVLVSVYLLLSLFISIKLTVIALACGLILVVVLWPINRRIHASGSIGLSANKDMHRNLFENVASLKMIKSFAAEEKYLQQMEIANQALEYQQVRMAKFNALTRWVNTVGAALIFTLLFYISIRWLQLPVANLLVILFIFSRLMPQLSNMQNLVQNLINQAPSYQDLMTQSHMLKEWAEPLGDDSAVAVLGDSIELEGVEYRHIEQPDRPVFRTVTERIKSKTTVAITGRSGAGKSTLADLISSLLEPTAGQIRVDGQVIDHSNRLQWRKQVAYVTQEVFLFHDSIRANLEWVIEPAASRSPERVEAELWQALEQASAIDFVRSLPEGLDTIIGDRGVKLSGGERQRLALARALLSGPSLLILDEATSALDRDNELNIRDALINLDGKLTIIIIAHDETTIEHVSHRIRL